VRNQIVDEAGPGEAGEDQKPEEVDKDADVIVVRVRLRSRDAAILALREDGACLRSARRGPQSLQSSADDIPSPHSSTAASFGGIFT